MAQLAAIAYLKKEGTMKACCDERAGPLLVSSAAMQSRAWFWVRKYREMGIGEWPVEAGGAPATPAGVSAPLVGAPAIFGLSETERYRQAYLWAGHGRAFMASVLRWDSPT